jgi:hypothetical protein
MFVRRKGLPIVKASGRMDHVKKHRVVDVFGSVAQLFLQVHRRLSDAARRSTTVRILIGALNPQK